jgi:hypothetical protein
MDSRCGGGGGGGAAPRRGGADTGRGKEVWLVNDEGRRGEHMWSIRKIELGGQ